MKTTATKIALGLTFFAGLAFGQPVVTGNYTVGRVPSTLQVYRDQSLAITLSPLYASASTITAMASPAPVGSFAFSGGKFTYTPDPTDTDFIVILTDAVMGGATSTEYVTIHPLAFSRPDADFIHSVFSTTAPDESKYWKYLETCVYSAGADQVQPDDSHGANQPHGRDLRALGDSPKGRTNGFYEKLNWVQGTTAPVNGFVTTLNIYVETLIISGGALWVPSANVNIWAREMRFDDTNGTATLDVTGISGDNLPGQKPPVNANRVSVLAGGNGAQGPAGGNITLHVQKLGPPTSNGAPRFLLRGGQGQKAGLSAAGAPGISVTGAQDPYPAFNFNGNFHNGYVNGVYSAGGCNVVGTNCDLDYCTFGGFSFGVGNKITEVDATCEGNVTIEFPGPNAAKAPTNGHDASPSGYPGQGGNGGVYNVTYDPNSTKGTITVTASGGFTGIFDPSPAAGGAPGSPNPYYVAYISGPSFYYANAQTVSAGKPAPDYSSATYAIPRQATAGQQFSQPPPFTCGCTRFPPEPFSTT